jgi:hypothetical protein
MLYVSSPLMLSSLSVADTMTTYIEKYVNYVSGKWTYSKVVSHSPYLQEMYVLRGSHGKQSSQMMEYCHCHQEHKSRVLCHLGALDCLGLMPWKKKRNLR